MRERSVPAHSLHRPRRGTPRSALCAEWTRLFLYFRNVPLEDSDRHDDGEVALVGRRSHDHLRHLVLQFQPGASWRYRPLNPIFTGAPSYSTGRRSRASPRSGLFVETSSCFPENERRVLFTLSGAMTLTRFRPSRNAPP